MNGERLPGATPTGARALEVLAAHFETFIAREPGTRDGSDPEDLHDMRVACRRMRAALKSFAPALRPAILAMDDELRSIGAILGAVRDLDVQLESLANCGSDLHLDAAAVPGLLQAIQRDRNRARAGLLSALSGPRYAALVASLRDSLAAEPPANNPSQIAIAGFAPGMVTRSYKQLRARASRLQSTSSPPELHRVRRRARRLRYTVEFVRELYGKPAERVLVALQAAQDLLGEHQDRAAAIAVLHEISLNPENELRRESVLLAGELIGRHESRMAALREEATRAFARVHKRWRALRRRLGEGREDLLRLEGLDLRVDE